MAGSRGYHTYRGRTPKSKIFLVAVLVLVILAATVFSLLQRYIVYDETGTPHLMLPEKDSGDEPNAQDDLTNLDITIQGTKKPTDVQAYQIAAEPLMDWDQIYAEVLAPSVISYNTVAVTLKDGGAVYFNAQTAVPGAVKTGVGTAAALDTMTRSSYHTIARLSCFHDGTAANADVAGMGLQNTGGYIFYDENNTQWLDPGKSAAREYLCNLGKELAELGFQELLLTDVTYPTEGKLDKIAYGESLKSHNLMLFLDEMAAALADYDITLSIELPEAVILEGSDNVAGLMLSDITPRVDRIYAVTTANHVEALLQVMEPLQVLFIPEVTGVPTTQNYLHLDS